MFYFIVSKAEFFNEGCLIAVGLDNFDIGGRFRDHHHKEIVSGPKHKFLCMLENVKVINAGFSFFINAISSPLRKKCFFVNRCFFNSNIANLHRLCQCCWF